MPGLYLMRRSPLTPCSACDLVPSMPAVTVIDEVPPGVTVVWARSPSTRPRLANMRPTPMVETFVAEGTDTVAGGRWFLQD